MSMFDYFTAIDLEKEGRRKRMEEYIRNLWGEEEIDLGRVDK